METAIFIFILFGLISGIFSRRILRYYPEQELRVDLKFPILEISNAVIYALVYIGYGVSVQAFVYLLLCSLMIWIAILDFHKYIIPDEAVIAGLILGIFFYLIKIFSGSNNYWAPILAMLLGPAFYLIAGEIAYIITKQEGIGGGDIKLMAPVGLVLGIPLSIAVIIISTILGGLVSAAVLLIGRKQKHDTIAFGPFISIATIIAALYGNNILEWYFTHFI